MDQQETNTPGSATQSTVETEGTQNVVFPVKTPSESVAENNPDLVISSAADLMQNVKDLLLKGWHQEALDYVNEVLGGCEKIGLQAVAPYLGSFDSAFRTACRKNNVIAAYVALEITPNPADNTRSYKMITGGHHIADAVISYHLRPMKENLGIDTEVKKPYLEVLDVERRKAFNPDSVAK
jgi:hypothetical protein